MRVLKGLFTLLVVAAILAAFTYFIGRPILSDWQLKDNYQLAKSGRLEDGTCRVKYGVLAFCDISIASQLPTKTISQSGYYFFVDFSGDDYSVSVIENKSDPTNISSQFALDKLNNRLISFVVVFVLLLLGVLGAIKLIFTPEPEQA